MMYFAEEEESGNLASVTKPYPSNFCDATWRSLIVQVIQDYGFV